MSSNPFKSCAIASYYRNSLAKPHLY
uniref:Uncharacterized protein n=1 Tax=Arundo donax TaxID=35708 RepID=A0A0A8YQU8_ARUDO